MSRKKSNAGTKSMCRRVSRTSLISSPQLLNQQRDAAQSESVNQCVAAAAGSSPSAHAPMRHEVPGNKKLDRTQLALPTVTMVNNEAAVKMSINDKPVGVGTVHTGTCTMLYARVVPTGTCTVNVDLPSTSRDTCAFKEDLAANLLLDLAAFFC